MTEEQVVAHEERAALESAYIMSHLNAQDIDRRTLPQSKARSPTHDAADDERRLIVTMMRERAAEIAKNLTWMRSTTGKAAARAREAELTKLADEIERGEHRSKGDG